MSVGQYEFFDPINVKRFYTAILSGKRMAQAILTAVRHEDGWEVELHEKQDAVLFRYRMGRKEWREIIVDEMPRAWEWWMPSPRRAFTMLWIEDGRLFVEEGPVIGNEAWCDLCGTLIEFRPVPLFTGNYALCSTCFEEVTGVTLAEAAALDGVELEWLDP
ncbi:hypothetical protein [Thermoflexus sp.]|uniref:hypothetical protein n=1 Tax=Thermoflexus sp. TaxID=1969742 RepID=UPI002ADD62A3|nr:hypothetical protein [Thermoflexus sp.]